MKEVVALEQAQAEIDAWVEWRKLTPAQIEAHAGSINTLVEGIQYGMLTLKDNSFTQKLLFPVGKDECVKELQYEPRVNSIMLSDYLKGTKAGDIDDRLLSYIECMTAKTTLVSRQHLKTLDPGDLRIANSIVVFFLT